MTIITARPASRPVIDLRGPQGNAFYLLGTAKRYAEELGKDWPAIEKEMMSSDYRHLIRVFDREFGEYVDLITTDERDFAEYPHEIVPEVLQ